MQSLFRTLRSLKKTPVLSGVIILTLGLGLGSAVGVFSLVDGVVLQPLPYPNAERVVMLDHSIPSIGMSSLGVSPPLYQRYRSESRALEEVAAYHPAEVTVRLGAAGDRPRRLRAARVTPSLFPVLGTTAALGRVFAEEEGEPGGEAVALIGHRLWQTEFGGDPGARGRDLEIDGRIFQVAGVMPEGFAFPTPETELWLPRVFEERENQVSYFNDLAIGLLAPEQTIGMARLDLDRLNEGLAEAFPGAGAELAAVGMKPFLLSLRDHVVGDVGSVLWVLLAAVGLILAIAAANVANLFLVRTEARGHETAIRGALGANRKRLILGFLGESLLLALAAGALGWFLAAQMVGLALVLGGTMIPRAAEVGLDPRSVTVAALLAVLSGLAFGLLPAIRSTRAGRLAVAAARSTTAGRDRHRLRGLLMVSQLALGVVLAVSCGLVVRSFVELRNVDPGFEAAGAASFRLVLPETEYPDAEARAAFVERTRQELAGLPGVEQVGAATYLPLSGVGAGSTYVAEGQPADLEIKASRHVYASAGYIEAMEIPLLEGRTLRREDRNPEAPNVLVSESFARRVWGEESPLGRRITSGPPEAGFWLTVVGVVGDVRLFKLEEPAPEFVYLPLSVYGSSDARTSFVLKTDRQPSSLMPGVTALLDDIAPSVAVSLVNPLQDLVDRARSRMSFAAVLLSLASAMALVIAAVGLYGTISHLVGRRRREIGIRMALGARRGQVRGSVLRQGLSLAAAGTALGLLLAFAGTRLLGSVLFGVSALDPVAFAATPMVLFIVAGLATWVPALRASRIEPLEALRDD